MTENFCIKCNRKVPIWRRYRRVALQYDTIQTTYEETHAICQYCGEEVYDPQINDRNAKASMVAVAKTRNEQVKRE